MQLEEKLENILEWIESYDENVCEYLRKRNPKSLINFEFDLKELDGKKILDEMVHEVGFKNNIYSFTELINFKDYINFLQEEKNVYKILIESVNFDVIKKVCETENLNNAVEVLEKAYMYELNMFYLTEFLVEYFFVKYLMELKNSPLTKSRLVKLKFNGKDKYFLTDAPFKILKEEKKYAEEIVETEPNTNQINLFLDLIKNKNLFSIEQVKLENIN